MILSYVYDVICYKEFSVCIHEVPFRELVKGNYGLLLLEILAYRRYSGD